MYFFEMHSPPRPRAMARISSMSLVRSRHCGHQQPLKIVLGVARQVCARSQSQTSLVRLPPYAADRHSPPRSRAIARMSSIE